MMSIVWCYLVSSVYNSNSSRPFTPDVCTKCRKYDANPTPNMDDVTTRKGGGSKRTEANLNLLQRTIMIISHL